MNYTDKSIEELTKELEDLHHKYDSLKTTYENDINGRKQTEEAHRDALWRLESIISGTNVGIWEWNIQTGNIVINKELAQIIGYTLEELDPQKQNAFSEIAHPDDYKNSQELLKLHFSGELPYFDFECRLKHKDGHWVWVHDRGLVSSHTSDGKPLMMFGTCTDSSERKQAEKLLNDIIDKNPISIQIVDKDGFTLKVNPAHTTLFGAVPPSGFSIFSDLEKRQPELSNIFLQAKMEKLYIFRIFITMLTILFLSCRMFRYGLVP